MAESAGIINRHGPKDEAAFREIVAGAADRWRPAGRGPARHAKHETHRP
jgi:hypothetical protein